MSLSAILSSTATVSWLPITFRRIYLRKDFLKLCGRNRNADQRCFPSLLLLSLWVRTYSLNRPRKRGAGFVWVFRWPRPEISAKSNKAKPLGALVHYSPRYAHTRAYIAAPAEHSPLYPPSSINQARRRTRWWWRYAGLFRFRNARRNLMQFDRRENCLRLPCKGIQKNFCGARTAISPASPEWPIARAGTPLSLTRERRARQYFV